MTYLLLLVLLSAILAYGFNLRHLEEKEEMLKKHYKELEEERSQKYYLMDSHRMEVEEMQRVIDRLKKVGGN
jgi:Tfp pilus assembly protein PilO